MATETAVRGFQFAGGSAAVHGAQFAGGSAAVHGGQFAGTDTEPTTTRGIRPRGTAYAGGSTPGYQFAQPSIAGYGGQYDGPADASIDDLIETDGFALVLENTSGSERLAFSPEGPAYQSIKTVSWTSEVNKMASWQATIPTQAEIFGWNFARAVIAYDGVRRFHGTLLNIETSDLSDGEVTLSGYGPLYWAGHGDIRASYSNIAAWRAIDDLWEKVAKATGGRVRGEAVRPRPEHTNKHWIPEDGVEWSGTPAEVLQTAHGYAGMAFAFDHSEQAAVATSFVPGEQLREVVWETTSVTPSINTGGYHNQVTVIGAKKPGSGESTSEHPGRYSATLTAPQREISAVMGGEIHGRTERDSSLESKQACRARASTLLAEDRGEFTVGGSLDVVPNRRVVPGYTYRIQEFDAYVPAIFSPVWCSLRSVSHSYGPGKATVSLSFEDESRLVEHIRQDLAPELAPMSIKRRDAQTDMANPNYDAPMNVTYAAGDGIAGSGFAGAAWEGPQ